MKGFENLESLGDFGKIISGTGDQDFLDEKFPKLKEVKDKIAAEKRAKHAREEIFGIKTEKKKLAIDKEGGGILDLMAEAFPD